MEKNNQRTKSDNESATEFLALMERYVVEYTNLKKPITEQLMVPEYEVRFGDHVIQGRVEQYVPLVTQFFERFPKLAITVHDVIVNGNRFAMRYSETAREAKSGAFAVWGGLGLYKWDGSRLTHNVSEQDWDSRERQISSGKPLIVEGAAFSPWETDMRPLNPVTEAIVRAWLNSGALTTTKGVLVDDEFAGGVPPKILEQKTITETDFFSAGDAVAFHIVQHGKLLPDFAPNPRLVGREVSLHLGGIVRVAQGSVVQGTLIRNKVALAEKLTAIK